MKNLLLLAAFLLGSTAISCQKDNSLAFDSEEKLMEIAQSDVYAQYENIIREMQFLVATKAVDLDAIGQIFDQYPEKLNMRDFDRDLFKNVRGGFNYYDIAVERKKISDELNAKYSFKEISLENLAQIRKYYKELTNNTESIQLQERIMNYYSNKRK